MKRIHSLLFSFFCFTSFASNAQTNWSETGKYWEPKLPESIISLETELLSCDKSDGYPKVCFSDVLKGAFVRKVNSIVLNVSFDDKQLFEKAKEIFQQEAREKQAIVSKYPNFDRFDAKEYALVIPTDESKTISIYLKYCLNKFATKQVIKEDPINTRISISGITPGVTTEKDILKLIKTKGFINFRKISLTPPDFSSNSSFLFWHSSFYEFQGGFFGLLGEVESSITFGDYNLIDSINIKCKWDQTFYERLHNELSKEYISNKSKLEDFKATFYPTNPSCAKVVCPSITISKEEDFLDVSLYGNQSYIGEGNYIYKWHKKREDAIRNSVSLFNRTEH